MVQPDSEDDVLVVLVILFEQVLDDGVVEAPRSHEKTFDCDDAVFFIFLLLQLFELLKLNFMYKEILVHFLNSFNLWFDFLNTLLANKVREDDPQLQGLDIILIDIR